ncbi:desulfoferrodoxin FeS4 iron-binding domain-containing protein [Desulfovibrio inopinatus]|nr:desulfoferrodoxin FeS4 iron-binding domain-containing protein [Desulfovibrio inopinatus]
MANSGDVYKCELCGQVVEVKTGGGGTLVCCGQDMEKQ